MANFATRSFTPFFHWGHRGNVLSIRFEVMGIRSGNSSSTSFGSSGTVVDKDGGWCKHSLTPDGELRVQGYSTLKGSFELRFELYDRVLVEVLFNSHVSHAAGLFSSCFWSWDICEN